MPGVLQGITEDEDGGGHERGGEVDDEEAGFGFDAAGVAAGVEGADVIVDELAKGGAEDGADDGGEVKHACDHERIRLVQEPFSERRDRARIGEERRKGRVDVPRLYGVNL